MAKYEKTISEKLSEMLEALAVLCLVFIALVILGMIVFVPPYFEMQAFNRHTKGEKATYLDALFADLRINTDSAGDGIQP